MRSPLALLLAALLLPACGDGGSGGASGPPAFSGSMRAADLPIDSQVQAVSPSVAACAYGDRVYAAWVDARHGGVAQDIYVNRSLDGGATWLPTTGTFHVRFNRSVS